MWLTELITNKLNRLIPRCAIKVKMDNKAVWYLHPTRGWKRVSWKRIGVIPHGA